MEKRSELNRREFLKLAGITVAKGFFPNRLEEVLSTDALKSPFKVQAFAPSPYEGLYEEKLRGGVQQCALHVLVPDNFGDVLLVGTSRHGFFSIQGDLEMSMGDFSLPIAGVYPIDAVLSNRNLNKDVKRELKSRKTEFVSVSMLDIVRRNGDAQMYNLNQFKEYGESDNKDFRLIRKLVNPDMFIYQFVGRRSQ